MGDWDTTVLSGPEGEDWRVPVSELENRLQRLARALRVAALPGALIQHPVDLYYFAGGRQDGSLFVPAEGSEGEVPFSLYDVLLNVLVLKQAEATLHSNSKHFHASANSQMF